MVLALHCAAGPQGVHKLPVRDGSEPVRSFDSSSSHVQTDFHRRDLMVSFCAKLARRISDRSIDLMFTRFCASPASLSDPHHRPGVQLSISTMGLLLEYGLQPSQRVRSRRPSQVYPRPRERLGTKGLGDLELAEPRSKKSGLNRGLRAGAMEWGPAGGYVPWL
ncbi:hypothetical protein KEM48_014135 [Puccinia striiformis f. sp. tritici PST-130]|uniref:Uncharacterized protein n=1 Tax=Puccinia striiformis f. sp. tritici PST-78 TaxID=1165861 RepID=A0A0L0UZC6_9BASI|nr:hypothetical protein KEM48_014135 [Puccinia striiformis f. sp. tritici PST-130]KNE92375.1 hypothetical protein PSTG_14210 [Puccinia striiformis f. sp. tritici PST-78]